MKGSEFAATFGPRGFQAWEAAAYDLARAGNVVSWPLKPVSYEVNGRKVTIGVASDYFAVGTNEDFLRLPLSPSTAQRIANLWGFLLPTPKLTLETWRSASVKLEPIQAGAMSAAKNLGANMAQFVEHNALINRQLQDPTSTELRSGLKKDVVIGNAYKPGKVVIYGWVKPNAGAPAKDNAPAMTAPWRIQPYSNIHGEYYFDYSHGIRFVAPTCTIDGQTFNTEQVLTDPTLAHCLSDEGVLKTVFYPTPGSPRPSGVAGILTPNLPGYAHYGLSLVRNGHVS